MLGADAFQYDPATGIISRWLAVVKANHSRVSKWFKEYSSAVTWIRERRAELHREFATQGDKQ